MHAQQAPTSSPPQSESSSCVKSLFQVHRKRSTRISKLKTPTQGLQISHATYNSVAFEAALIEVAKLSLTLVELVQISLLECYSGMSFINLESLSKIWSVLTLTQKSF